MRRWWRAALCVAALAVASACSPPLDWRDARFDGGRLAALFPCRPVESTREAALSGMRVRMTLHACRADGSTFAVTHTDVADPRQVAPALARMQAALAANLGAPVADAAPFRGEDLPADAVSLRLRGTLPDGVTIDERALLFARGTRIYQAAVVGPHARGEAAETFMTALRLAPP